ncbi:hypothetical protein WMF28_33715 [Sorangium sp. So ce590]|uniref:hypothetical protein n=1 Tax=Sorangium sp. So ce590 TaxID=3133317 RepID=UPI003F5EBDF4
MATTAIRPAWDADIEGAPFVAKLTESGTAEWVITPEPSGTMYGLAPDVAGGAYAAGRYDDGVTLDYTPFALHASASSEETALQRYASSAGSSEGMALTSGGTLWVAGLFRGSIDVGSGRVASPSTSGFVLRIPRRCASFTATARCVRARRAALRKRGPRAPARYRLRDLLRSPCRRLKSTVP